MISMADLEVYQDVKEYVAQYVQEYRFILQVPWISRSKVTAGAPASRMARTVTYPDSKVHGANMGPIWGRQDPGGPHVGPMNVAIWVYIL